MSTQKWPDDDLDDIFRKSAEESDPAYDPAAWQDLRARLNSRDRTLLVAKLLRWGLPILSLLLSIGGVFWYDRLNNVNTRIRVTDRPVSAETTGSSRLPRKEQPTHSTSITPETGQTVAYQSIRATSDRYQNNDLPKQPALATHTSAAPREKKTTPASSGVKTSAKSSRSPGIINQHQDRVSVTPDRELASTDKQTDMKEMKRVPLGKAVPKRAVVAGRQTNRLNGTARQDAETGGLGRQQSVVSGLVTKPVASDIRPDGSISPDDPSLQTTESVVHQEEPAFAVERFAWPTPGTLAAKPAKWSSLTALLPEPSSLDVANSMPRPARSRLSGLSVQVVLSPDLSAVGLRNFDRPGSNIGLLAQYQLSERFSLQTGALWSTKRYTTPLSEYVWPFSGYTHVFPESITGRCTMIDIPVNLRYDILLRPGGIGRGPARWFVSGGATSYFINREVYDYNYANPNNPDITRRRWDNKVAGRKGGRFGLSHLNVSVGYERPVGQRLSWQIEPFMKIPVQEVGFFKVRLLSTGAFLSLRYRL
ncbi:MAG: hypothetical protein H7Z72_14310 [Bacteroidetes bacterium]|nr:hypothetical protein [Fibrella sp.]